MLENLTEDELNQLEGTVNEAANGEQRRDINYRMISRKLSQDQGLLDMVREWMDNE